MIVKGIDFDNKATTVLSGSPDSSCATIKIAKNSVNFNCYFFIVLITLFILFIAYIKL